MKTVIYTLVLVILSVSVLASDDHIVIMNVERHIYHYPECMWAKQCTQNCIQTTKDKAIAQGARPCKICGG